MNQLERALVIGACIFAIASLQCVTTQAATYYVATTGSDTNSCAQAKSASTPKETIPAGVNCLSGGDTLIIKAGTYVGQQIKNPPAGTDNAYTIIKGDPSGARPVIRPNGSAGQRGLYCDNGSACHHIEMRYLEVREGYNAVKLWGSSTVGYAHHIRIIDNYIYACALLIATSPTGYIGGDHLIQGNEFDRTGIGNPGYKPGVNTIYNTGNRTIVEGNTFHNLSHGVGIWMTNVLIRGVIVRNNVFYDIGREDTDTWQQGQNSSDAIHVSAGGGDHYIYNNVIYRSGDRNSFSGIVVKPYFGIDQTLPVHIYNNTIYDIKNTSAYAILTLANKGGPHVVKNNIAYLAGAGISGGTQSNNLTDDPSFKDPARADLTLQSKSAALDAGEVLAIVTTDFRGVRRPQGTSYDIGAYETGDGSSPLPPQGLSAH